MLQSFLKIVFVRFFFTSYLLKHCNNTGKSNYFLGKSSKFCYWVCDTVIVFIIQSAPCYISFYFVFYGKIDNGNAYIFFNGNLQIKTNCRIPAQQETHLSMTFAWSNQFYHKNESLNSKVDYDKKFTASHPDDENANKIAIKLLQHLMCTRMRGRCSKNKDASHFFYRYTCIHYC